MKNKKLKVTVYAISKNEEQFVDRWFESMKEADNIVVLDTGSTDNTVEKLKNKGIFVKQQIISPWRFDKARNESLKLVPQDTDICVCTDLDEVFTCGWRKKLEENWTENTKQLKYIYVWNVLPDGRDGTTFLYEKIHSLKDFKWIYPVHEILQPNTQLSNNQISLCKDIVLRHFPDPNKSRAQYLNLLELSVKENPQSDRNTHYLAREYMFNAFYDKAIKMFKKHLNLKTSTWKEERSASLRYIGDCYLYKNMPNKAKVYYEKAILENFDTRESYLSLAKFYYFKKDYLNCCFVLNNMLNITNKQLTYMTNPDCWNEYPYDLLSFSYFNLGKYDLAIKYTKKALEFAPQDTRLLNNLSFYNNIISKNK